MPGTQVDEIASGIYRISSVVPTPGGDFSFNQFLVKDDEPLLYHTGPRRMWPATKSGIERVLPVKTLRHIAFCHVEADECGALNSILEEAPEATPVCSTVAAMVSVEDLADRAPRPLADGEVLETGQHRLRWLDMPHLPHGWESGYLFDELTRTLFAGDLFTQGGSLPALVETDILEPSEDFRLQMDYFSHGARAHTQLLALASLEPRTLACMHGSSYRGDGSKLLHELAERWA